jgi:hypothetical protein
MQPVTEAETTFSGVFEAPGSGQNQIFEAAKVWIAQKFVSAKAVVEHEDKQEGILIGNGITDYPCKGMGCSLKDEWGLAFTMRVDVKDNKFKLTFTNVKLEDGSAINWRNDIPAIREKLLAFGPEIQAAIQKNKAAKDW